MDMTDEQLLERFFQPAREQQIADRGFTQRVAERLPERHTLLLSRLWTLFCVAAAAVVFYLCDGWSLLTTSLNTMMNTPMTDRQLLMQLFSTAVVALLAVTEVLRRESAVI